MAGYHIMDGDRVRIKEIGDEPEQYGKVIGDEDNGTYMVEVDEEYLEDEHDDGLREVPVDQLELIDDDGD